MREHIWKTCDRQMVRNPTTTKTLLQNEKENIGNASQG